MKKTVLAILALFACASPVVFAQTATPTVTATITYTAPTLNTDGSAIAGAITYNLYAAAQGTTPVLVESALTASPISYVVSLTTIPYGTTECFAVTAVANGVESALSTPLACKTFAAPTPSAPTSVTVTLVATPAASP
jgi:hypothetical protein